MSFEAFSFGSIRIDGVTYEHDVIIDHGYVRKRKKKASKKFTTQPFGTVARQYAVELAFRQIVTVPAWAATPRLASFSSGRHPLAEASSSGTGFAYGSRRERIFRQSLFGYRTGHSSRSSPMKSQPWRSRCSLGTARSRTSKPRITSLGKSGAG